MNLFDEEVGIAPLLRRFGVPVDAELVTIPEVAREVGDGVASGRYLSNLGLIEHEHAPRVAQHGGDVGSEEVLAVAQADDHRAVEPRADESPRMRAADDGDSVRAGDAREGAPHGLPQAVRAACA